MNARIRFLYTDLLIAGYALFLVDCAPTAAAPVSAPVDVTAAAPLDEPVSQPTATSLPTPTTEVEPTATSTAGASPAPTTTTAAAIKSSGRIAFVSYRDGDAEIYTVGADGAELTQLTNSPENDVQPAWSPDGNFIAFTSTRHGDSDIYRMRADGSQLTRLTDSPRTTRPRTGRWVNELSWPGERLTATAPWWIIPKVPKPP